MQIYYLLHNKGPNYDEYALYEDREDAEADTMGKPGAEVISLMLVTRRPS